jgi:hypothetical protein
LDEIARPQEVRDEVARPRHDPPHEAMLAGAGRAWTVPNLLGFTFDHFAPVWMPNA